MFQYTRQIRKAKKWGLGANTIRVIFLCSFIWLCIYAKIVHTRANQLLPQVLMEQFDTFLIQCRHIEHMHKGVWFRKKCQNDSYGNLDNISLIGFLYMHWWCLQEPINFCHSFWWSNSILCLYNKDTLNICSNFVCCGNSVFTLSVRVSVRNVLFP